MRGLKTFKILLDPYNGKEFEDNVQRLTDLAKFVKFSYETLLDEKHCFLNYNLTAVVHTQSLKGSE